MPKREKTALQEIVRYESGVYYYRGPGGEKSLKTKDWDSAVKRLEVEKAKGQGSINASILKVKDIHPDYLDFRKKQRDGKLQNRKSIRVTTYSEIEKLFAKHLLPFFKNKKLSKIDEEMWDQYCERALVSDLSNHRKVFGGFLRWCKRKKYIRYVPDLEIPPITRRKKRVLTEDEIKGLIKSTHGRFHLFFMMALLMGLRRGEIIRLRWEIVKLDKGYLIVTADVSKTNQERLVVINSYCLELLRRAHSEQLDSPWVFPNRDNLKRHMSDSGFKGSWSRAKERVGIEGQMTWGDLRATCEKYAHLSTAFTDSQREKFYGSSTEVQKRIYVHRFSADELRGLEDAVQVEGLSELLISKLGEKAGKESEVE